jgi:hypothetical protein
VIPGRDGATEICYRDTEYKNILEIFEDRAMMHTKVYTHRSAPLSTWHLNGWPPLTTCNGPAMLASR